MTTDACIDVIRRLKQQVSLSQGGKMFHRLAVIATLTLLVGWDAGGAFAQNSLSEKVNAGKVTIITGGFEYVNNTYMRLAGEMAAVADEAGKLRVLPIMGQGPVENIRDILYLQGIDIGVIHSDALTYVTRRQVFPNAPQRLRFLAKLYDEFFHLIAHRDIKSVNDLAGRKVVIGKSDYAGSTISALTAFDILGIEVKVVYDSWESAVERIKSGEVAAMMYSTVRGSEFVQGIEPGDELHLLSLPFNDELAQTYLQTQFTSEDYPNLIAPGQAFDTLQFATVMAVYSWDPSHARYQNVAKFVNKLFDDAEKLKVPPYHRRWKNFDPAAEPPPGWTRLRVVQEWLTEHEDERTVAALEDERTVAALKENFAKFLPKADSTGLGSLTEEQKAQMFNEFLAWAKNATEAKISVRLTKAAGVGKKLGSLTIMNTEIMVDDKKEKALILQPDLNGFKPGSYAFHIHQNPDCGPKKKDGKMVPGLAAGDHLWLAGTGTLEGQTFVSHLGDLPDFVVDKNGTATKPVVAARLSLADVVNRAIVIHASNDDTSPRYACGVVK